MERPPLRYGYPGLAGRAGPCGPAVRQARTVPRIVRVRAHLLASRGCRITRFVRCAHCAQTGCGKSVDEARCARPPRGCAARRPIQRPRRAPSAAQPTVVALVENHPCLLQRAVRARCGVRLKRRGAQGSWPASAASLVNTFGASCLSVANAVSEASYAPGHGPEHRRAAAAQRRPLHPHAAPRPDSPLLPRNFACRSMHRVSATGRRPPAR